MASIEQALFFSIRSGVYGVVCMGWCVWELSLSICLFRLLDSTADKSGGSGAATEEEPVGKLLRVSVPSSVHPSLRPSICLHTEVGRHFKFNLFYISYGR